MEGTRERVEEQIRRWANELIDLSRRNTSLYYRPLKRGTVEITAPSAGEVLELVQSDREVSFFRPPSGERPEEEGRLWTVEPPRQEAKPDELVASRTAGDLDKSLSTLSRQTELDLVDKGLQSLYLCFGMLEWQEAEAETTDVVHSPLVFVPVRLTRSSPREAFRLVRADEDEGVNVSLQELLQQQFGLSLPEVDTEQLVDRSALDEYFRAVEGVVAERGWQVRPQVVLKRATFHKEAMFRDLQEHIDEIAGHDLVAALADPDLAEQELALDPAEPPAEDEVDAAAPPEQAHHILDADASQRRAVHAAKAGTSFVMDGPPGTGKSQTIANVLAELMAAGKSVLFVSEKIAALDVVASRLADHGLEHFLFPLHSHKASRKEVAVELGRTLGRQPKAAPHLAPATVRQAQQTREQLSAYVEAINRVRQPLGRSVHWVAGRLSQLSHIPTSPLPGQVDDELSDQDVAELSTKFAALARVWQPVTEGEQFQWRGLRNRAYSDAFKAELSRVLDELHTALESADELGGELAYRAGVHAPTSRPQAQQLVSVLERVTTQPATEPKWWSMRDLDAVGERLAGLEEVLTERRDGEEKLVSAYGSQWREVPAGLDGRVSATRRRLEELAPQLVRGEVDPARVQDEQRFLEETRTLLESMANEAGYLARSLGVSDRSRTVEEIVELASICTMADAVQRPEPHWASPMVAARVEEAASALAPLAASYQSGLDELREVFDDEVLELDVAGMTTRFEEVHRGVRKLGGAFRADKRALAAVSKTRKADQSVRARLPEVAELQRLRGQLDEVELRYAEVLGSYYRPRSTDTEAVSHAVSIVRRSIDWLGPEHDPEAVAAQLAGPSPTDHQLGTRAHQAYGQLTRWRSEAEARGFGSVAQKDIRELVGWAEATATELETLTQLLTEALQRRSAPASLPTLHEELLTRTVISDLEQDLGGRADADREALGSWYAGEQTDCAGARHALEWTKALREEYGGALPDRAVQRLHNQSSLPSAEPLAEQLENITKAQDELLQHFDESRSQEVGEELDGSFKDAVRLVEALTEQLGSVDTWFRYLEASEELRELGWNAPLDFCVEERLDPERLSLALEKAMYAAWYDAVVAQDHVLAGARGDDLDAAVVQFRKLDHELIADASEWVVQQCVERRPRTSVGQSRIIESEANKKKKHMPVRKLLGETADVTRSLKPVFMMSPLSVSQFLPSDFRFDVIVFDEASQITPADAVNCIYRGDQLIVAGDDRQLPPTSFFQQGALEDDSEYEEGQFDVFESVLGQCKRTPGMHSLPLRWHYRSQHESLITFSNYSFYEGNLVTFPSAQSEATDLGVELFRVNGTYRRGGPRDNPVEAATVAERVLHHARQHPHLSLGVVAFSQAQADAIEDAVERARVEHPDLEDFFNGDRLHGFFVKNLESVQGDERDIMLFSVGYGPDEVGKLTMHFGPLNMEGGWRRLNVAVTRARRRVEVISSFGAADMDTRGSSNEGVKALQKYLDYAERGVAALSLDLSESEGDAESPLEESVLTTIRGWGYDVVPQLGAAGYRLDMAVRDPQHPGRFALGIECDGAAYHSSKVARDRDRLRQEVLEGLGWRLHRIWGPSWYEDRPRQETRLREVIEAVRGEAGATSLAPSRRGLQRETEEATLDEPPAWGHAYEVAVVDDGGGHHPADPFAWSALRRAVEQVLRTESPVHEDLVAQRIAWQWGFNTTKKVRGAVADIVLTLSREGLCERAGSFLWLDNSFNVRVPVGDDENVRRDVEHIPPEELQEAVYRLLHDAHAATEDELLTQVGRLFGFARIGAKIRVALDEALAALQASGAVTKDASQVLRPVESAGES